MARPANEILEDYESEWAPRLRAASLAAELQLNPKRVQNAVRCLGLMQKHQPHKLSRYPASMVMALSGIGALEYDAGNYWSPVWEYAGLPNDGNVAQEWGRYFLRALGRFGCPTFAHLPRTYVGPILLHAGVPRYSLGDLVDLVLRRADADASMDGHAFVDWATAPGRQSRLQGLDKPVQSFLRDGGEFAIDWTDRLIDLLDRLREPSPDLDGVRLPAWVVEDVQSLMTDRALRGRRQIASTTMSRAGEDVRLALDPYGLGIHLVLPPVGDQPDGTAVWRVTIDGVVQVIRSRASWPAASQTVPGTTVVLSRPARSASASLGTSALVSSVDVVDPEDPLLVFGDDGRRLPASLPLPPEPVWVLHPTNDDMALQYEGEPGVTEAAQVPYGWDGWALERVDLALVRRLRAGKGTWRTVRGSSRARLDLPRPVAGVMTAYDSPVWATPPRLVLPSTDGVATGWSLIVRRPGGPPLVARDLEVTERIYVDAFDCVPRPLLGPYQVVVRGPLGRGLSREIDLVEGLVARADPPWREFAPRGLVPCVVELNASQDVRLSPRARDLGSDEEGMRFEADGGSVTEILQLVPPHMAASLPRGDSAGRWSAGPLQLETESLGDVDVITVRVPSELTAAEAVLVRGDEVLQRTPATCTAGLLRLDLRRFSDTLATVGSARLELEVLRRRIPLATIRPRRLAASVQLDESGCLSLAESAEVQGLQAAAYPVFLPWRAPVVRAVTDGTTASLGDLRGQGRLLVSLRVDDPWLPAAWPEWPERENTFRCDQPADELPEGWEGEASRWLLGEGKPPAAAEAAAALLKVYELHDRLLEAGVGVDVRTGAARALAQHPRDTLEAAVGTTADARSITAAVVHAGLPLRDVGSGELPGGVWGRSALAAVLLSSRALRSEDPLTREDLRHAAGPVVDVLLAGEADPSASVGRFGPDAAQLAGMPKEVLDQVWRAANIVPTHLLDEDSRATAARQLFEVRTRPGIRRVASVSYDVARRTQALLERQGWTTLMDAVRARSSAHGWQSLPAFSIAVAVAARLSARDHDDFTEVVEPLVELWAVLARHAPDLVELDVVLAECLVLGAVR